MPSPGTLTQKACFAIAATLWNQKKACYYLEKHFLVVEDAISWESVVNYVLSCVEQLDLPDILKLNLKGFIPVLGWEIVHWFSIAEAVFEDVLSTCDLPLNFHFVWNDEGIIDIIQTAKATMNCNLENKFLCYSIASLFSVTQVMFRGEAYIYLEEAYKLCQSLPQEKSHFLSLWMDTLNPNSAFKTNADRNEKGCVLAHKIKCVPALKYFLDRMPTPNKDMIKMFIQEEFRHPKDRNMLYFLLSQLEESERKEIIMNHTYNTLQCLIEWPHQEYFMTATTSMWNYISKREFCYLFCDIAGRVSKFYPSILYINLIKEFWHSSPAEFKAHIISGCVSGKVFVQLFLQQHLNVVIQMLFDECTAEQRQQIIFTPESMDLCEILVMQEWWDYLELFVFNCIPSKEIMKNFSFQLQSNKKGRPCLIAIFLEKTKDWY